MNQKKKKKNKNRRGKNALVVDEMNEKSAQQSKIDLFLVTKLVCINRDQRVNCYYMKKEEEDKMCENSRSGGGSGPYLCTAHFFWLTINLIG